LLSVGTGQTLVNEIDLGKVYRRSNGLSHAAHCAGHFSLMALLDTGKDAV
jgi:hypothetical protein